MTVSLDSESRIQDDDHLALKLWLRMLTCTNMVENNLRRQLRENFQSTLPRFDLLAQLYRHPDKLTMGELSSLMMVSAGNVTALVGQLEKEGLLKRTPLKTDRRIYQVELTRKGRKHFSEMAKAHEVWVAKLFDAMGHDGMEALMDDLGELKAGLRAAKSEEQD